MVTVRHSHSTVYNPGETMEWLCSLGLPEGTISCLLAAEQWLQSRELTDASCPQVHTGWEMVEILADLRMDKDALTAALLFPLIEAHVLSCDDVQSEFPSAVVTMLLARIRNPQNNVRYQNIGPHAVPTTSRTLPAVIAAACHLSLGTVPRCRNCTESMLGNASPTKHAGNQTRYCSRLT